MDKSFINSVAKDFFVLKKALGLIIDINIYDLLWL